MEITSPARFLPAASVAPVRGAAPAVAPPDPVRTELPAAQAVAAPAEAALAPLVRDRSPGENRAALLQAAIDKHLTIDPGTRTVVFRAVERGSGDVLHQYPSEGALKLRAYVRQFEDALAERRERDDAAADALIAERVERVA